MLRRKDNFAIKYQQFKDDLRGEILSGSIKPSEFILPENTLSEKYQISRVSVRKVLAELVEEGLIEKIPGKGNRVIAPAKRRETIQLAWFSTSYEIDIVQEIIKQYRLSQPFADVELTILPESGYTELLVRDMEQGGGPDVCMISDQQFRELLSMEKTDLLHPYVSPTLDPRRDSYEKVFELFRVGNNGLMTPFLFSPVVICYNEQLFEEAGLPIDGSTLKDWDALLSSALSCTLDLNGDQVTDRYGFCFSSSPHRWPVFVLHNEGGLTATDGSCSIERQETIESLNFCLDLMYKHQVSPIYSHGSEHLAEALFSREKVAMILSTYYFMNEFRGNSLRWNVQSLPKRKTEGTLLLGGGLGINRNSKRIKLAENFVDYMVGEEAQTLLKRMGCTIPVRKAVAENDQLLDPLIHPSQYNVFKEVLPYAKTVLELGLSQHEIKIMREEMQMMWANLEQPQEACRRITEKIVEHRQKNGPL